MPPKRAPALARLDVPRLGLSLELRIILKKSIRRLRLYLGLGQGPKDPSPWRYAIMLTVIWGVNSASLASPFKSIY